MHPYARLHDCTSTSILDTSVDADADAHADVDAEGTPIVPLYFVEAVVDNSSHKIIINV